MTGPGYIAPEKPQQCDLCGKIAELRPYGPKGECVCYECGMKDPEAVSRGMNNLIFGGNPTISQLQEVIRKYLSGPQSPPV